jgi:hypothetical protein
VSTYNPVSNKDDIDMHKKASRTIKQISGVGRIILQLYAKSLWGGFIWFKMIE